MKLIAKTPIAQSDAKQHHILKEGWGSRLDMWRICHMFPDVLQQKTESYKQVKFHKQTCVLFM